MSVRKVGEEGLDLAKVMSHLDGRNIPYREFRDLLDAVRAGALGVWPVELSTDNLYNWMMAAGWITFPDDDTSGDNETVAFKIVEDQRIVRRRIEQLKKQFIRERALQWLDEKESDGQVYPLKVDLKEYELAIRELAEDGCAP